MSGNGRPGAANTAAYHKLPPRFTSRGIWSRVVFGDFSGGGLLPDAVVENDPLDDLGEQRVGVLVDEVREVIRVDSTTITAPGPVVSGLAAAYIAGIVTRPERTIIILNARKLLSSTERLALTAMGSAS